MDLKNFSKYKYWLKVVLIWTIINLILSLFGSSVSYLFTEFKYIYSDTGYWLDVLKDILFQGLLFIVFTAISNSIFNNKIHVYYSFTLFQFILLNIIVFCNLEIYENKVYFVTNDLSISYKYLYINGQYLFDFIYSIIPFENRVDGGGFAPGNFLYFYIMWIFLPVTCYFIYTFLSLKMTKFLSKDHV